MADPPELLVVASPNGSGKTTLALAFAANSNVPYLGADAIAEDLAPGDPSSARLESGRRFIDALDGHVAQRESLIVETTLSGKTFRHIVANASRHMGVRELSLRPGFERVRLQTKWTRENT